MCTGIFELRIQKCNLPATECQIMYGLFQFCMSVTFSLSNEVKNNKKLSYCCDSRSYCMQKYDRLKQLLRDTLSILTPGLYRIFTVIAASRPVNKNVNTGAVIRAKPGTDRAGRS